MKRTQIYLTPEQHDFLDNLAFSMSKKRDKKVTISKLIREAIELLKNKFAEDVRSDDNVMSLFSFKQSQEALADYEGSFSDEVINERRDYK